jgi:hypothetical protein
MRKIAVIAVFMIGLMMHLIMPSGIHAEQIEVRNTVGLKDAIRRLKPGTTVILAPGEYQGGIRIGGIHGTEEQPIVIRGADPEKPPRFRGGSVAIHLSDSSYVTLSDLSVSGFPGNGINIDDGGTYETPAHHIVLENIIISDTGPRGNHDALKMSGVTNFIVRDCVFHGWGGSGIDMVGCHRGIIRNCRFIGKDGYSQSNGVQTKGASSEILVHLSFFQYCGHRSINLGGSTDLRYFRLPEGVRKPYFEATDITIAGCRFVGSMAPLAWVGSRNGHFHHNTIYLPEKWVVRILQENTADGFLPCQDGIFEHNLVVFDSRVRVFANVGPNTAPKSFTFHHNSWYQTDGTKIPLLPTEEKSGIYCVDPKLELPATDDMRIGSGDRRFEGIGADAYQVIPVE